eukprot:6188296-Pleurochrysis_carterae.AAC.2
MTRAEKFVNKSTTVAVRAAALLLAIVSVIRKVRRRGGRSKRTHILSATTNGRFPHTQPLCELRATKVPEPRTSLAPFHFATAQQLPRSALSPPTAAADSSCRLTVQKCVTVYSKLQQDSAKIKEVHSGRVSPSLAYLDPNILCTSLSSATIQRIWSRKAAAPPVQQPPSKRGEYSSAAARCEAPVPPAAATAPAPNAGPPAVAPPRGAAPRVRAALAAGDAAKTGRGDTGFFNGIREIVLYLVFLALLTVVISTSSVTVAFAYSNRLRERVVGSGDGSLYEVVTLEDMWSYLSGQLLEALYTDDHGGSVGSVGGRQTYVLEVDKLIGAMRLEQSRVRAPSDACTVPPVYEEGDLTIDVCYPSLRSGGYSECPFGGSCNAAAEEPTQTSGCPPPPCDDSFEYLGEQGGALLKDAVFTQDLPTNMTLTEAELWMDDLLTRRWIDLQTRRVRVLFSTYNPSADLFCSVELVLSPAASGGVAVHEHFLPFHLLRHMLILTQAQDSFPPSATDYVILIIEITFYMLALFLFFQDQTFDPPPNVYENFYTVARSMRVAQNLLAVACILSYLKLLRYLELSPRLSQLTRTARDTPTPGFDWTTNTCCP